MGAGYRFLALVAIELDSRRDELGGKLKTRIVTTMQMLVFAAGMPPRSGIRPLLSGVLCGLLIGEYRVGHWQ